VLGFAAAPWSRIEKNANILESVLLVHSPQQFYSSQFYSSTVLLIATMSINIPRSIRMLSAYGADALRPSLFKGR
jgi:hypothetical protein